MNTDGYTDYYGHIEEPDNCSVCKGARGGVRGNENNIDGVVMCDYCHAEHMDKQEAK
jgi:hypothetical protein